MKLATNDSKIGGKLKKGVILTGLSELKEGVLRSVLTVGTVAFVPLSHYCYWPADLQ